MHSSSLCPHVEKIMVQSKVFKAAKEKFNIC